jgi:hypothetical protein
MKHNQTVPPAIFTSLHIAQLPHQKYSNSFPVKLLHFSTPISVQLTKSRSESREFPRLEELPFMIRHYRASLNVHLYLITSSVFIAVRERTIQISRAIQGVKLMALDLRMKILED